MAAGLFTDRRTMEAEGFRFFNLGADVAGMGEYFRQRLATFGQGGAGAAGQGT